MAPRLLRKVASIAVVVAVFATCLRSIMILDNETRPIDPMISRAQHPYVAPGVGDSRSPCPALNTLANHGYLPHNGRGMSQTDLIRAMRQGYDLSLPLASFIAWVGSFLLMQFKELSLTDLARHNCIEHNGSLGHADVKPSYEYAPTSPDAHYVRQMEHASSDGAVMTFDDFVRIRVKRDSQYSRPLDSVHEKIALGEISLVLGIFGGQNESVPVPWVEQWWMQERLPDDFIPDHTQGLLQTTITSMKLKSRIAQVEKNRPTIVGGSA
ncbi:heme-thiolate peroxidase [Gelatoporia subvermispora B]|uniref:Heme-thiolate peroxidase n=1 Tax=Ceriporiopsis subvermispora (strain B) TaxID=914234 RepID=M2QVN4_CERS8|nr:heme-thiolate peroxidase [Gelatoporia subvermispora B]